MRPGLIAFAAGLGLATAAVSQPTLPQTAVTPATATAAQPRIVGARFEAPTLRYPHGALGDDSEWGRLVLRTTDGEKGFDLPERMVFEDLTPRLADLDGDGYDEAIVVEADRDRGARLAIWGVGGRIAATEYLGFRFRWLAPVGAADLDGDGAVEIAYVESPHLRPVLRVVRLSGEVLVPVAKLEGVTNHRLGQPLIEGGIARCPSPVLKLADPTWGRVRLVALSKGVLSFADFGPYRGPVSLDPARGCKP